MLDTKRDCGAKGNGVNDDTVAIQGCINRARKEANGTLVYFPSSSYVVSSTISVEGANYRIGDLAFTLKLCGVAHQKVKYLGFSMLTILGLSILP